MEEKNFDLNDLWDGNGREKDFMDKPIEYSREENFDFSYRTQQFYGALFKNIK